MLHSEGSEETSQHGGSILRLHIDNHGLEKASRMPSIREPVLSPKRRTRRVVTNSTTRMRVHHALRNSIIQRALLQLFQ